MHGETVKYNKGNLSLTHFVCSGSTIQIRDRRMVTLNNSLEGILQFLQANFGIAFSITVQHLPSTNSFLTNNSNNLVIRHQENELVYKVAISEIVLEEAQNGMSDDYFSRLREIFDVLWQVQSLLTIFSKCGTNCNTQRRV
jgi:hypothetical protein